MYINTKYVYYRRLGLPPARVRIDLSARPPVRPSSTPLGSYALALDSSAAFGCILIDPVNYIYLFYFGKMLLKSF